MSRIRTSAAALAARPIDRAATKDDDAGATFGQRAADVVASFGGSWVFVGLFVGGMVAWVWVNALLAASRGRTFDPYPYILLNLFLSMLAAIQAPVILMSQNRHSERERLNAEHDYEVNLQAERDIRLLHDKLDLLREQQWAELLALQQEQLERLATLIHQKTPVP